MESLVYIPPTLSSALKPSHQQSAQTCSEGKYLVDNVSFWFAQSKDGSANPDDFHTDSWPVDGHFWNSANHPRVDPIPA